MGLVGRRQAIIAAILRLTITDFSEQGWECQQVYRTALGNVTLDPHLSRVGSRLNTLEREVAGWHTRVTGRTFCGFFLAKVVY